MTAAENKASLKAAFEELSKGNGAPFADMPEALQQLREGGVI